jgi:pimeloyl-ACP methyl ester carboxylesterase
MRQRVEGQTIDGADFSLRARGSNRLTSAPMGTLAYYTTRDRRILFVHGYNVEERSGQNSMAHLRSALIEGCARLEREILTVTWPGNASWLKGGPAAYFAKVPVAKGAGRLFGEHLAAEFRNGGGPRQLVIVAHSLGCRLTLEFLSKLNRATRPRRLKKVIAILMAPAVPVELQDLIEAARSNADELIILHSEDDKVLKRWFRLGQTVAREGRFPEAIGLAANPRNPPWSYHQRMHGYDHGDYWTGQQTADVIGEQLGKYFSDIAFRASGMRAARMYERPTLDETGNLPEY